MDGAAPSYPAAVADRQSFGRSVLVHTTHNTQHTTHRQILVNLRFLKPQIVCKNMDFLQAWLERLDTETDTDTDIHRHRHRHKTQAQDTDTRHRHRHRQIILNLRVFKPQIVCEYMDFLQAWLERLELIWSPAGLPPPHF